MFKGLSVCYTVIIMTFFTVAISGYWAFGNESEGLLLSNFVDDGKPLVPKWFILMTNIFTILQLSAVGVVRTYLPFPPILFINIYLVHSFSNVVSVTGLLAANK